MSRWFGRVGTQAYKYEVELQVLSIRLAAGSPPVYVRWSRGDHVCKTALITPNAAGVYEAKKTQNMKIICTMYMKKKTFQEKESEISIRGKGDERLGSLKLDLSEYVSASSEPRSENFTLKLQKAKDKNSVITCKITTKKRGEVENEEEVSRSTNREDGSSVEQSEEELSSKHHESESENHSDAHEEEEEEDHSDDDARTALDGKRKVQFVDEPAPRSGRGSVDPKKGVLKGSAAPAKAAAAPAATNKPSANNNNRKPARDDDDEDEEEEEDAHDGDDAPPFDNDIPFFKVTLSSIMQAQAESNPDLSVPIILDCLIRGLERMNAMAVEGIFRLSVTAELRDDLKRKLESGDYTLRVKDPHILANVLKNWMAELKQPVIEEQLVDLCLQIGNAAEQGNKDSDDDDSKKKSKKKKQYSSDDDDDDSDDASSRRKKGSNVDALFQQFCSGLPQVNRMVLLRLCNFINKCCLPDYTATSKMSLHSFAVVFTPNVLRLKTEKKTNSQAFAELESAIRFFKYLCAHLSVLETAAKSKSSASTSKSVANPPSKTAAASTGAAKSLQSFTPSSDDEHDSPAITAKQPDKKSKPPPIDLKANSNNKKKPVQSSDEEEEDEDEHSEEEHDDDDHTESEEDSKKKPLAKQPAQPPKPSAAPPTAAPSKPSASSSRRPPPSDDSDSDEDLSTQRRGKPTADSKSSRPDAKEPTTSKPSAEPKSSPKAAANTKGKADDEKVSSKPAASPINTNNKAKEDDKPKDPSKPSKANKSDDLSAQLSELTLRNEEYESHIIELEDELEAKDKEIARWKSAGKGGAASKEVESENAALKAQVEELKRYEQTAKQHELTLLQHTKEWNEKQEQAAENEQKHHVLIELKDKFIEQKNIELEHLHGEVDALRAENESLTKELSVLQGKYEKLQKSSSNNNESIEKYNEKLKALSAEHTQLSIVLKDTRVELTQCQQENQELKKLLEDNDIALPSKKSSKSPKKSSSKSSNRDEEIKLLDELNAQHKHKESILTSLIDSTHTAPASDTVGQLQQTIAQLQSELQQLKSSSSSAAPALTRSLSSASREYFGESPTSSAQSGKKSSPQPPPPPPNKKSGNSNESQPANANQSLSFQQLNQMYVDLQKKYNDLDISNIELKLESQEKDKRVKELVKSVKNKEHEIEELLASKHDASEEEEPNFADMSEKMLRKKIGVYYQKSVDLQDELNAVNVKINQLNDELDEMFDSSKALKKELKSVTSKYEKQAGRIQTLEQENEHYKELVATLAQQQSVAAPSSNQNLDAHTEQELHECREELIALHEHVHELEEQIAAYQSQVKQLSEKNAEAQSKLAAAVTVADTPKSKGKDASSSDAYKQLETKYNDLNKKFSDLKAQNASLVQELADAESQHEAEIKKLKKTMKDRKPLTGSKDEIRQHVEELEDELTQAKEQNGILKLKLENVQSESAEKLEVEKKNRAALQQTLTQVRTECEQLRQRSLQFEELSVDKNQTDVKKNARDKLQMDLITAYNECVKRIKFLTQQLKESDDTLMIAQQSWNMSAKLLNEQIKALESEVAEYKRLEGERLKGVSFDEVQLDALQKKLKKAEQAKEQCAQATQQAETELNRKKVELTNALNTIVELQNDNKLLKDELVRSGIALKTIADDNFELKEYMRLGLKKK